MSISFLCGQTPDLELHLTLPVPENISGSPWDKVVANPIGDMYLLDIESGTIVWLDNIGQILNTAGGIGLDDGYFSDPVDISQTQQHVVILDRMANRLTWFDRKLQYISTDEHAEIYPELFATDPNGNCYILSSEYGEINRRLLSGWDPSVFIDLYRYLSSPEQITSMTIGNNAILALLTNENHRLILFNNIGRMIATLPITNMEAIYITPWKDDWILWDNQGRYRLSHGEIKSIQVKDILDVYHENNRFILLTIEELVIFIEK